MAYELFCDSFETSLSAGRWVVKESPNSSLTIPSSGNGRRGGASMRHVTNSGYMYVRTQFLTPSSHVACGIALRSNANVSQIRFMNQNSASVTVIINLSGLLQYRVNNGAITSTTKTIPGGAWNYLEVGAVIAASGSFTIKVNGEVIANVTGVDTRAGGSLTTVDNVELYNNYTTTDYDDFYVTYGNELKWLGDIRVDALALTANSTPQDWTPDTGNAWERLNNASAGTITGTTLNQESRFALADYTPATTAIHGMQVSAYGRKTDAGSRSMAIEVKSGSTVAVGPTIALGDTTTEYRQVWLTDPNTAAAWTDGGLDALELGVKVMD